ncbi:hypothetical protein DPV78_004236 [Talaromyces pinophilus]|nr:hypothetical protein DPV78_004236 [Talaromyces pinophilus]
MDGYNFKLLLLVQSVYTAYWIIGINIALNYMEPSRASNFIFSLAFAIRYMLLIKEAIRAESIPPQRLYTDWVQSLSDNNNSTAQATASNNKTAQHPLDPDLVVIEILAILYTCILLILEAIGYEITAHTGETIAGWILPIPVRSSIWIWGDTPSAAYRRNPKFSIHNSATATWLILGTCCALVIFGTMVVPPLKPLALLGAVIACELLFRWGLELVAAVVPFRLLPLRLLGLEDVFLRNKWFLVQYFSESWLTRCLKRAVIWPFGVFARRLEKHDVGETTPLLYDRQSRSAADRV